MVWVVLMLSHLFKSQTLCDVCLKRVLFLSFVDSTKVRLARAKVRNPHMATNLKLRLLQQRRKGLITRMCLIARPWPYMSPPYPALTHNLWEMCLDFAHSGCRTSFYWQNCGESCK
jgi:hypothetical protein